MDFTIKIYRLLLESLLGAEYKFITFHEYLTSSLPDKLVVLRHDVDLLPLNSLHTARIEHDLGIKGVYYFRSVPESWDESVIKEVAELGHEVGYHYENLTICKGDLQNAYHDFQTNLQKLRKLVPVKTICMHGSPRSPHDSREIWKEYSYKDLGIVGEPYFDADFSKIFYLTDTGRRWDGYKVSVRDKIVDYQGEWDKRGLTFHTTKEIINAIDADKLPDKIMITVHPQRWNNFGLSWIKELLLQNLKNIVKRFIVRKI
jgi:hypothetical protein